MFRLSITSTILRYYLMMVVAIIAVYTHQMWLIAVVMAIAVSAILGYRIGGEPKKESKIVHMKASSEKTQRKAS